MRADDLLQPLGTVHAELAPGVRATEIYTMEGMLGLLWHGPIDAEHLVVACPGGMGGYLGPGTGLYPALARRLARHDVATVVVDYRSASRLEMCVLDAIVAVDLAAGRGAERVIALGHSFGGAVAVNVGLALPGAVIGVCTLSTQSAGCEGAAGLAPRPFLLLHGEHDEILPAETSEVVRGLADGHGEVEILPGEGHGLAGCSDALVDRLGDWAISVFGHPVSPPK
ncbi:MAG: alpha/beta hydrolase [Ilumatobacter sp.]|nr:MAG: alpha/beta hydrolase [Ilumatobacter sp.]